MRVVSVTKGVACLAIALRSQEQTELQDLREKEFCAGFLGILEKLFWWGCFHNLALIHQ